MKTTRFRTVLLFLLTGMAWGTGFMFIRIGLEGTSVLQLVFGRFMVACVVLSAIMLYTKQAWPRSWRAWRHIIFLGVVGMFLPSVLFGLAGERIPSALSSIYNSSAPVLTVLITLLAFRQETVSLRRILAIGVGAVGVLIVLSPWKTFEAGGDLMGQLYALLAVVTVAVSFAYTRKFVTPLRLDPVGVATGQALVAGAISIPAVFFSDLDQLSLTLGVVASIFVLGAVSSGLSFVWNFQVIEQWGASAASMVTYVSTITGVFAGIIFLRESLLPEHLVGAGLVLCAVTIGVNSPVSKRNEETAQLDRGP